MMNLLVEAHIIRKAKKMKKCMPTNCDDIIQQELSEIDDFGKRMIFAWLWSAGVHVPNASATIPGIILLNAEWAAHIALYQDNENMHLALRQTIGHEITHQENDYFFLEPFTKDNKFVYWINEVHADFGSVEKMFRGNREFAIRAMRYKFDCKKLDKDAYAHPSWRRRISIIENEDFTDKLIREIAKIVGCKNEGLINRVIEHFEPIYLRR